VVGLLAKLSTPVQSHNTPGFGGGQRELHSHSSVSRTGSVTGSLRPGVSAGPVS